MLSSATVRSGRVAAVVLFVLAGAALDGAAQAGSLVDQTNLPNGTVFDPSVTWQQGILAGMDGSLQSIDLFLTGVGTIDFAIFTAGAPWHTGTPRTGLSIEGDRNE